MLTLSPGWMLDVERGPDWLIITPHSGEGAEWECPPLAANVWSMAVQHFTYRVVLDLSALSMLSSAVVGQLVLMQKRLWTHDGVLRLCGLSDHNREVLQSCRLDGYFPLFHDRNEAVMGTFTSQKPR